MSIQSKHVNSGLSCGNPNWQWNLPCIYTWFQKKHVFFTRVIYQFKLQTLNFSLLDSITARLVKKIVNSRNRLKETTANPCPNSQLPDVKVAEKAAVLVARTPHHPGRKKSPMSMAWDASGLWDPQGKHTYNIFIYNIYIQFTYHITMYVCTTY
jgi:hypothetical protein